MPRKQVSSGSPWEPKVGYSRAVRVGSTVHVSGTAPADPEGNVLGGDDPYLQAVECLKKIQWALEELGAGLEDVVRTRMYVANIDHWEAIGRAHGEFFGAIRPATTMVEVSRLISPEFLVEIEAEAEIG